MIPLPPLLMNKYLWVAVAAAFSVLAATLFHLHAVSKAEDRGYSRGLKDERLVWQVRENHELNAANALITQLQEKYRALEKKSADDIASASFSFLEDLDNVRKARDQAIAAARTERLRWAASCSPSKGADGGAAAGPSPAASEPVGAGTCELPRETEEALIREAARADRVVAERNALLAIAKSDREVCK